LGFIEPVAGQADRLQDRDERVESCASMARRLFF
jgi:hypothetical protein